METFAVIVATQILSFIISNVLASAMRDNNPPAKDSKYKSLEEFLNVLSKDFSQKVESAIRAAFIDHSFEDIKTNTFTAFRHYIDYSNSISPVSPDGELSSLQDATTQITQAYQRLKIQCDNLLSAKLPNAEQHQEVIGLLNRAEISLFALESIVAIDILILAKRFEFYPALYSTIIGNIDEYKDYGNKLSAFYINLQKLRVSEYKLGRGRDMHSPDVKLPTDYQIDGSVILKPTLRKHKEGEKMFRFCGYWIYTLPENPSKKVEVYVATDHPGGNMVKGNDYDAMAKEQIASMLADIAKEKYISKLNKAMNLWDDVKYQSKIAYLIHLMKNNLEDKRHQLFAGLKDNKPIDNELLSRVAAQFNHHTTLQKLIELRTYIDNQDPTTKKSPLHLAIERHSLRCVSILAKAGAKIDLKDSNGNTSSDLLKQPEYQDAVVAINSSKFLSLPINKNSDFSGVDLSLVDLDEAESTSGDTVLHKLVRLGVDTKALRKMLEYQVDTLKKNLAGKSPFGLATELNNKIMTTALSPETRFLFAAKKGDANMMDHYLRAGTNVNHVDPESGNSALHTAAEVSDLPLAERSVAFLLERGINFLMRNRYRRTAEDVAYYAKRPTLVALISGYETNHPIETARFKRIAEEKPCSSCKSSNIDINYFHSTTLETIAHVIVRRHHIDSLIHLIESHEVDIDAKDASGKTPLQLADESNFKDLIPVINVKLLARAIQQDNLDEVIRLLRQPIAFDLVRFVNCKTILDILVSEKKTNSVEILKNILQHPFFTSVQRTDLIKASRKIAVQNAYFDLVEVLDNYLGPVNSITKLLSAICKYNTDLLNKLIIDTATANSHDMESAHTPLKVAALTKNKPAIDLLFEHRVDFTSIESNKIDKDIADYIKRHIAKRLFQDLSNNVTTSFVACLRYGADMHYQDDVTGKTLLHVAVERFDVAYSYLFGFGTAHNLGFFRDSNEIIPFLIKQGASLLTLDKTKSSPIDLARKLNKKDLVRYLEAMLKEAFVGSIRERNIDTLLQYLNSGVSIHARNNLGRTALHEAIRFGAGSEIIIFLLKAGSNPYAKDSYGATPLTTATTGTHPNDEYAEIIKKYITEHPYLTCYRNTNDFLHNHGKKITFFSVAACGVAVGMYLSYSQSIDEKGNNDFRHF